MACKWTGSIVTARKPQRVAATSYNMHAIEEHTIMQLEKPVFCPVVDTQCAV